MTGKDLRIIFMGTPDFAVASLKALVEHGYQVVGVVTMPDKPAGRGQKLQESAVKKYAAKKGLTILQPEKLKDPGFIRQLESLKANLQVVVAFRMLPEVVWSMPPLGTFNLHGSLLPRYRGAAPLNWAIINGEQETGVTTFLLDHEIDTGRILFQEKIQIEHEDTVGDIHDKLMAIGAGLVLKTVDALAEGHYEAVPQAQFAEKGLVHAPKIFKEDCRIDWTKPARKVYNFIRGLSPYPAAWTELTDQNGQSLLMKIFFARLGEDTDMPPGTLVSNGKNILQIAAGGKLMDITDLQISGKKRMKTEEFLRGVREVRRWNVKR